TDINTSIPSSFASDFVPVGNEMFFIADNPDRTFLWQSDGTGANIVSTSTGYMPTSVENVIAVGSTLFFTGSDANGNYELWTSGTGTQTAAELSLPDAEGRFDSNNADAFAALGSELYFGAYDLAHNEYALWKSDGTAAGTAVVADLSSDRGLAHLTAVGSNLFWEQYDDANSTDALWKYNGTTASQATDINNQGNGFNELTAVGSRLYFQAYDSTTGAYALWTSDGTAAGTKNLMEFTNKAYQLYNLTSFNGELFFAAPNPTAGQWQMWTSTGTTAGTTQLFNGAGLPVDVDINTGDNFLVAGSEMYFSEYDYGNGIDVLAKTDGTAANTVEVQAGTTATLARGPAYLAYANGLVLFEAYDSAHGWELWQSDGTAANTMLLADINKGTSDSSPGSLTTAGNQVFFTAYTDQYNTQPWVASPTTTVVSAGLSGPSDGVTMQPRDFVLSGTDSNSNNNGAGYSFSINWGDGTTETVTAPNQQSLSVSHQYASTGSFTVSVTATNLADNVSSVAVTQVETITGTEVQGGNLAVGGVAGNDTIAITRGTSSSYDVDYNGSATLALKNFKPAVGEQILLYGGNGTTTITATDSGTTKDSYTLGQNYVTFVKATFVNEVPASWTVKGNTPTSGGNTFTIVGPADASLIGGNGPNTFNFTSTGTGASAVYGSLAGTLTAGSNAGNTLSFARYARSVIVNLLQGTAFNNINNTSTTPIIDGGATGGITGISNVTGSSVGGDILVGNASANVLKVNKGHNILIAGSGGGDTLDSGGADIMIAGTTSYDTNTAALQYILNEWKAATSSTYATIINNIETSATDPLSAAQVTTHTGPADTFNGHSAADVDWFFAHETGSTPYDLINNDGSTHDTTTDI
ncbi:MAG TPA: hypothetical protein VFA18_05600, partial [Gemmataceae bacterium]|nr:hypothetical protein [Gemmataceae bacterium]